MANKDDAFDSAVIKLSKFGDWVEGNENDVDFIKGEAVDVMALIMSQHLDINWLNDTLAGVIITFMCYGFYVGRTTVAQ